MVLKSNYTISSDLGYIWGTEEQIWLSISDNDEDMFEFAYKLCTVNLYNIHNPFAIIMVIAWVYAITTAITMSIMQIVLCTCMYPWPYTNIRLLYHVSWCTVAYVELWMLLNYAVR